MAVQAIEATHVLLLPAAPPHPPPYLFATVRRPTRCRASLSCAVTALLLLAATAILVFVLWPSKPQLRVVSLRLDHVHLATSPSLGLDVALDLRLEVRNRNFLSLDYRSLVVAVAYRGGELGCVQSAGGHVQARGVSDVNADVLLDGVRVINDVIYLIEDYARGDIPLDTVTTVDGRLHFLFFDIPVQGTISCTLDVDAQNQTLLHTTCF